MAPQWARVLVLVALTGCAGELLTPQETLKTMVTAANEDNLEKFYDCLDSEHMKTFFLSLNPSHTGDEASVKNWFLTSPWGQKYLKNIMWAFREFQFSILYEKDIGENARRITVTSISKRNGSDRRDDLVFFNRHGKWQLSPEETWGF